MSLSGRTTSYSVRESQNSLAIPLELTTAAAFDIDVFIEPTRYTASELYIYNIMYCIGLYTHVIHMYVAFS